MSSTCLFARTEEFKGKLVRQFLPDILATFKLNYVFGTSRGFTPSLAAYFM
jgi:hypothetical protein